MGLMRNWVRKAVGKVRKNLSFGILALVKDYVVNIWETCKLLIPVSVLNRGSGGCYWVQGAQCQGGEPDTDEFQFSSIMKICCSACENRCMVDGKCNTLAN